MAQEVKASTRESAVQAVLRAQADVAALLDRERELEALLETEDTGEGAGKGEETLDFDKVADELALVSQELAARGGAGGMEGRARRLLYGLGFSKQSSEKPTSTLSGGCLLCCLCCRCCCLQRMILSACLSFPPRPTLQAVGACAWR